MSNISFGVGVGTNGTGIISNAGLSAEGDQGIELPTDEIWMDEATTVNKSNDGAVLLSVSKMRNVRRSSTTRVASTNHRWHRHIRHINKDSGVAPEGISFSHRTEL